jgi:hypothetical protein
MRVLGAVSLVAVVAWGCAPTIIDDPTDPANRHASGGGPGHGGSSGGLGGAELGGSSASTSSTTSSGTAGSGGLGPTSEACAEEDQSGSVFGAACAYAPCAAAHAPPAMIQISAGGGRTYCMDTRTVSAADYAAFLEAKIDPGQQPSHCLWNETFAPGAGTTNPMPEECPPNAFDPVHAPNAPATCVDLCDAEAYCLWAGKRLCGRIGGGDVVYADDGLPSLDQFTFACDDEAISFTERPAADVYEWEPVCESELTASSLCNVRDQQCYLYDNWLAGRQSSRLGFRCCAD